jgi:hypothetical protein
VSHVRDDGILTFLRRRRVEVALLVVFTFLVGVFSQRLFTSIDEGYQYGAAQHSIPYIITHDPQNHPFYGVLAHLAMQCLPDAPIAPVRLPAFLAGLLVPLVFYLTNRRYAGHEAALLVAMILVMMDPVRYYMSVGRGYSLMLLGVLVLNHLVIAALRRRGWWRALVYIPVGVASGLTHLWAFPVVGAHGVFLALEVLRRRGRGVVARRALGMLAAVAATLVIGVACCLPMLSEVQAVSARRGSGLMFWLVVNAVLQIPRFASWTVVVHLLLVPIVLEGFARRPLALGSGRERIARMNLVTIVVVLACASVANSIYFGSRYLLGMVPAAAGLVARGLSGYWRGRTAGWSRPRLARPAAWTIGLALGLISANAPMAHEIPGGATTADNGKESAYYYRNLAQLVGTPRAVGLLAVGVVGLALAGRSRRGLPAEPSDLDSDLERRDDLATAYFWTAVLLASMGPLVLGPAFSLPLFEVHMLTAAAVLLDAWEHRFSDRHLHALRFAFLMIAVIAVLWQVGVALPQFTPWILLGVMLYIPPVLIVLPLARTTRPAFCGTLKASPPRPERGLVRSRPRAGRR